MRTNVYWHAGLAVVLALCGCLKTDNQQVKQDGWTEEKKAQPPESEITDAPKPRISAATYLASGRMVEQQNDFIGAIHQYEKALETNPKMVEALNRLGIVYQKMERFDDAERAFKRGVIVAPDSAMLHNNLGYCYLIQDRLDAAEREFRAAIVIAPAFGRARMNLGIILARTGRIDESIGEFSQVVTPDVAYYNVAIICIQSKQYAEARDALERSLKINPDNRPAREQLDIVNQRAEEPSAAETVHVRMANGDDAPGADNSPTP